MSAAVEGEDAKIDRVRGGVVANQYAQAYDLARNAKKTGTRIDLPLEF